MTRTEGEAPESPDDLSERSFQSLKSRMAPLSPYDMYINRKREALELLCDLTVKRLMMSRARVEALESA